MLGLFALKNRRDDIRRQARENRKLSEPGTAAAMLLRDGGEGSVRVGQNQLPCRMGFSDERDELLIALGRWALRWRTRYDEPQLMTAPDPDRRDGNDGVGW
jgi:hypothetical protein